MHITPAPAGVIIFGERMGLRETSQQLTVQRENLVHATADRYDRALMLWYGVRCLFEGPPTDDGLRTYEERITIWQANSLDQAIETAIAEAQEFAKDVEMRYLSLAQAYEIGEDPLEPGADVFSLIRASDLESGEYLSAFFDTGREFQKTDDE